MYTGLRNMTRPMGRQFFLIIPLIAFVILKFRIDQNGIVWSLSWYTRIFNFMLAPSPV